MTAYKNLAEAEANYSGDCRSAQRGLLIAAVTRFFAARIAVKRLLPLASSAVIQPE